MLADMRLTALAAAALLPLVVSERPSQSLEIGIIDFYGLHRITETQARAALTVKEGDTIAMAGGARSAVVTESERRLSMLAGVRRAHLQFVCCDGGKAIVYVGVEETDSPVPHFRDAPRGRARLAVDVVEAGRDLSAAQMAAVQRGDAGEDISSGHSLMHDPAARAVQERLIGYARDLKPIRDVLRNSSDAEHRALAAEILGYAQNTRDIIDDLVYGMTDPSDDVRNNAMRALALIGHAASAQRRPLPIPVDRFVTLLNSPVWTDRNKVSLALMFLTETRDPALLSSLRAHAMVPLVEMARWKSRGHAEPALLILGRVAGQSDEEVGAALERGDRDAVIGAALRRR